jgi:hypothetical protein
MSSPPRPILKHTQSAPLRSLHPHHAVHFPPSPSLTRTFTAYSPSAYDRSPIVVAPNSCALPERGCPGRTYTLDETAIPSPCSNIFRGSPHNGRDLHPRALAFNSNGRSLPKCRDNDEGLEDAQRTPTRTMPVLPPLIPDLSSESDESDSFSYSPQTFFPSIPSPSYVTRTRHHGLPISNPNSHDKYDSYTSFDIFNGPTTPTALSFLPHPPSPPSQFSPHDDDSQKTRRRRERRRERSRSRSRERERDVVRQVREEVDAVLPSPRKSRSGPCKSSPIHKRVSSFTFEDPDVGCLGGF